MRLVANLVPETAVFENSAKNSVQISQLVASKALVPSNSLA